MPENETVKHAALLIRQGRLVAFPTETVYGLGSNALDAAAVERIYDAKQRPRGNPLIVHVCSIEMARGLAREWPEAAEKLAKRFWPGPLTLVVPKQSFIPDVVTGGLDTVGLRMPAHPLALELIAAAGVPIAAPSANPYTRLSPTTAAHVRESLGDAVDLIIDGGPAEVGIESTVLSLAGPVPRLLRPGAIGRSAMEDVIGPLEEAGWAGDTAEPHPSPGLHPVHYSPRTPLVLVSGGAVPESGRGVYLAISGENLNASAANVSIPMPCDSAAYAAILYGTLHKLDHQGFDWIAVEIPPSSPEWTAIHDRLQRAARR